MHRLRNKLLPALMAATLCLAACDKAPLQHSYLTLPTEGWRKADTLCFPLHTGVPVSKAALQVEVRHSNGYPYRNLHLALSIEKPDSTLLLPTDTLRLMLTDNKGRFAGNGGVGTFYQSQSDSYPLALPDTGVYHVRLIHCMGDTLLRGVSDVGVCVTNARFGTAPRD